MRSFLLTALWWALGKTGDMLMDYVLLVLRKIEQVSGDSSLTNDEKRSKVSDEVHAFSDVIPNMVESVVIEACYVLFTLNVTASRVDHMLSYIPTLNGDMDYSAKIRATVNECLSVFPDMPERAVRLVAGIIIAKVLK